MTILELSPPRNHRQMRRSRLLLAVVIVVGAMLTSPARALAQVDTIDPSDPRLVPNPIESSDEGTAWICRTVGAEILCDGTLTITWPLQEGPGDWCAVPLYSVDGTFMRTQTRYYAYDAASNQYLEYKRLVHRYSNEFLTPDPDPASENVVEGVLRMTWTSAFQVPGDLDSRITRKQGIDTFIKSPSGGIIVLDVGQTTENSATAPGDDFNFKGRWDIALGDPAVEFGKVCAALGV